VSYGHSLKDVLDYDLDQIRILTIAALRLDAERRLAYIVDTMTGVGGLFSDSKSSDSPLNSHLSDLLRLAGYRDDE
jgi:hypothetical protein